MAIPFSGDPFLNFTIGPTKSPIKRPDSGLTPGQKAGIDGWAKQTYGIDDGWGHDTYVYGPAQPNKKKVNPNNVTPSAPSWAQARPKTPEEQLAEIRKAVALSDEDRARIAERARKEVAGVYKPQIKAARRDVKDLRQDKKKTLAQIDGAFETAGGELKSMGAEDRRASRQAKRTHRKTIQANRGSPEGRTARNALNAEKRMSRGDRSFNRMLQNSLSAEAAIVGAGAESDFNRMISGARSRVGDLRGEMKGQIAATRRQMMDNARSRRMEVYKLTQGEGDPKQQAATQKAQAYELAKKLVPTQREYGGNRKAAIQDLYRQAMAIGLDPKMVENAINSLNKSKYEKNTRERARAQAAAKAGEKSTKTEKEYADLARKIAGSQASAKEIGALIDDLKAADKR